MSQLSERLAALSQQQRARLAQKLGATPNANASKQLVAYVVFKNGADAGDLKNFLGARLPNYMLPAHIIALDALPRMPNGKVDRKALPDVAATPADASAALVEPRNEIEKQLAQIWSEVLGLEIVGIHDNFFEIGGDSLVCIQIVARARRADIFFTPTDVFDHPTIAALAAIATASQKQTAEQTLVIGAVPLTPIQHWFFEHNLTRPQQWNQGFLLRANESLDPARARETVAQLLKQHDALRARFWQADGKWHQEFLGMLAEIPFEPIARDEPVEKIATRLHRALNLETGALIRFAQIGASELLIVCHHLVVDNLSWRVLLQDFETIYRQAQLAPKTTSFKQWSEQQAAHAESPALIQERAFWLDAKFGTRATLPRDFDARADNSVRSAQTVTVALDAEETRALMHDVPPAYRTQINDALLTALARVLAEWTNANSVLLALEGHGRESLFEGVDVSRTVGWFTTVFPVALQVEAHADWGQTLVAVKEQLRAIPNHGIGHGILRYLSRDAETREKLSALPEPEIVFNYLGRLDETQHARGLFEPVAESVGEARHPDDARQYLIEINSYIRDGAFHAVWTFSENAHRAETIARLAARFADALRQLIRHCQSSNASGVTASDFALASLNQNDLSQIANALAEVDGE
ncbi:MAG: hypothetical protein HY868_08230 [Chloroflexi bacterium]|nr:hypothetical protein [Chloroflexota bacterium]